MKAQLLILLMLYLGVNDLSAQETISSTVSNVNTTSRPDSLKNTNLSLNDQYQILISKAKNYDGFKVLSIHKVSDFWKSVSDTIAKDRLSLIASEAKVVELKDSARSMLSIEEEIDIANKSAKQIVFLGIEFSKGSYHFMVWSIIIVLSTVLFLVIASSIKNIREAKLKTELYETLTTEFQKFKSWANEKERKLARELQDERNLVEELKNSKKSEAKNGKKS